MYRSNLIRAAKLLPYAVRLGPREEPSLGERQEEKVPPASKSSEEVERELRLKVEAELREAFDLELRALRDRLLAEQESWRRSFEEERTSLLEAMRREAEAAKRAAREEGFKAGREEGLRKGYEEGMARAREEVSERAREFLRVLEEVASSVRGAQEELLSQVEVKVVRILELLLSRLLRREVELDGDVIVRLLREVFSRLSDRDEVTVYLSPRDFRAFEEGRAQFADFLREIKSFKVVLDEHVEDGGCVVETRLGVVDARVKSQLERLSSVIDELLRGGEGA